MGGSPLFGLPPNLQHRRPPQRLSPTTSETFSDLVACHVANVGGHASQRDNCHACAAYVLLRRWEASPPTLLPMSCFGRKRCSAPMVACHVANVGGHASQRDNCHACAAYALLRRRKWRRLLRCCLCAASGGNAVPPLW